MMQLKKTLRLLRRSPYQALAAMLAMAFTFFIASIFILLIIGGQIVLKYVEERPTVSAFFKDDATESRINEISVNLKQTGLARDVKYVSKEEALAIYRERFKDDPKLLESVTADFLPASIDVFVKRPQDIDEISKILKSQSEVSDIIYPKDVAQQLTKWTKVLRFGGIIFVSTLMAISFLIIIMVVGMRIALRRDEISIMNLVGATKWFISRPFFIEGALYGFVGATFAVFISYAILLYYSPNIQDFLGPIQVFPISPAFFLYLWVGEVLVAAAIGIIGAAIALYRYLRIR